MEISPSLLKKLTPWQFRYFLRQTCSVKNNKPEKDEGASLSLEGTSQLRLLILRLKARGGRIFQRSLLGSPTHPRPFRRVTPLPEVLFLLLVGQTLPPR